MNRSKVHLCNQFSNGGFWSKKETQLKFLNDVAKTHNIKVLDDWYKISADDFIENGGRSLLRQYGGSISRILSSLYPNHNWQPWRFGYIPDHYWKNPKHQREFCDYLAKKLEFKSWEDWYQIDKDTIIEHGGKGFISNYSSTTEALQTVYPELPWQFWKFSILREGTWTQPTNQRKFLNYLFEKMNFKNWEDWYSIKAQDVIENGGGGLLRRYHNSLSSMLMNVYSEYDWQPWKFLKSPVGYWSSMENRKKFMDSVAKRLKLEKWEDWYEVEEADVERLDGGTLLRYYYQGSLRKALQGSYFMRKFDQLSAIYPQHPWKPIDFEVKPRDFYRDSENQKEVLSKISKILKISEPQDWYRISPLEFVNSGGGGLLSVFSNNLLKLLQTLIPEYTFLPFCFKKIAVPIGFWQNKENGKIFFDFLFERMKFKTWEDWYSLKRQDIIRYGGVSLLIYYNDSHIQALMTIYPDYPWKPWKFETVSRNFWEEESRVSDTFRSMSEELSLNTLDDWKLVTAEQLDSIGGFSLRRKYGGMLGLLQRFFPDGELAKIQKGMSKIQFRLFQLLNDTFPKVNDIFMSYAHPNMRFSKSSDSNMTLDVYIPSLNLAFEYQGEQHYENSRFYGEAGQLRQRDEEKRIACKKEGITLIEIPYWWDNSIETLKATIQVYRPELINEEITALPIPGISPKKEVKKKPKN